MKVIGCDPGAFGAVAIINTVDDSLTIIDMPTKKVKRGARLVNQVDAALLASELKPHVNDGEAVAFIERVHAMPGQGVSSMFAFGRAAGVLEGVLSGLGVPFETVPPATWTKQMRSFGGKDGSRSRAIELYPSYSHLFARKKDDGRAEATLIACYGIEKGGYGASIRLSA